MPDLGKYAADVLSAYGVAAVLLIGLVLVSLRQGNQAKRELEAQEARLRKNGK
ncbi:MAG: heme exporter protein CcmD [Rhodobacteraceae bacterium]|nr:heme exporter protein CcmD [Paracoccaceae bacterium]